jgi:hypothetical protein
MIEKMKIKNHGISSFTGASLKDKKFQKTITKTEHKIMRKIKFILPLFFALFIFVATANAQHENHFGLKAAMNASGLSKIDFGVTTEQKMRMSFAGGLFFNHELSKKNSLHIEGLYSMQGADITRGSEPRLTYRLDYIALPVYFRHHFKENRSFSVQFGVQPSYLMNSQAKIVGGDEPAADLKDYFASQGMDMALNNFDVGISGGLGFGFGMFSTITLTYTHGLMDVFQGSNAPSGVKNYLIQFGLCLPLTSNTY